MQKLDQTDSEEGVALTAEFGVSWREATLPDDAELAAIMSDNESLLASLAWLEEGGLALSEETSSGDALARVETKLNFTISLLGFWLRRQLKLPARRHVILGESALTWTTDTPPPLNEALLVELYPSTRLPMPLVLPATAHAIDKEGTSTCMVHSQLLGLSEGVANALSRTIFRYHRRLLRERHQTTDD